MKSEANTLQQLSKLKAELDKYQRTYGTLSTLPPDASQLAEQLHTKELELEKLRLLETERKEVRLKRHILIDHILKLL